MHHTGLALGGGGLRGAAHIGVLQVLEQEGLRPQRLAGSSAGSIAAALYAAGIGLAESRGVFRKMGESLKQQSFSLSAFREGNSRGLLDFLPLGIIPLDPAARVLSALLGEKTFARLDLPLAVVATDLYTGEKVVFTAEGNVPPSPATGFVYETGATVAEAVTASIAIPFLFVPRKIKGRLLADGGIADNVPADVLRAQGAEKIVAVDLGFAVRQRDDFQNLFEVGLQSYDIMGQRITDLVTCASADLVLRPRTGSANLWDVHRIPAIISAGRQEALRHRRELRSLLAREAE